MSEHPPDARPAADPSRADPSRADPSRAHLSEPTEAAPSAPRRQPGEPHPYMLQRNPPNLWILVALTAISLAAAALVMALTVLL